MRVRLRDDEVVDVEQLAQALHRQVVLQATVPPTPRAELTFGLPRNESAVAALGEQRLRREERRKRAAGGHRGPDDQVRGCEVVEQPRLLPSPGGAHAHAEDPPAAPVVRLLEGEVAEKRPEASLEKVNVVQRAGSHEVLNGREKVPPAEEGHVREQVPEVLLAEELVKLLGGTTGDDRGDDAAHAAPRQHPREQPP